MVKCEISVIDLKMIRITKRAVIFCSFFCALLLSTVPAEAGWRPVGNVTRVTRPKPNRIVMDTTSRGKVSVEFFEIHVVRILIEPTSVFERDFSYAIDYSRDRHTPSATFTQSERQAILKNFNGAAVTIGKTPFSVRITDESGAVVLEDDPRHPTLFDSTTGEIRTSKLRKSEVE